MPDIRVQYLSPSEIDARQRAYRKHGPRQIELIAQSLRERGCVEPILIDSKNRIVCGEAVVEASRMIGLNRIPVVRADHLSDEQLRAYALAANKLAELSGYDEELLAEELRDVSEFFADYDLTDLGFEAAEIDRLLGLTVVEGEQDAIPDRDPSKAMAKLGDLWHLGDRHRLFCGDALAPASYKALMGNDRAQLVLSDVPYNLDAASISGNGKFKHADFVQAAGELNRNEFTRFLTKAMRCMRDVSQDGTLHMIFMSWHYLPELLRAGTIVYDELKAICTWIKHQGGQGAFYRSQTEFIAVFKQGKARHINNIQLGRFGRNRTNAWMYQGMNTASSGRDELLALHPTVKPLDLLSDAILDCSNRDGIVLDPFVGSGSTILAADAVDRRCYAMELDPLYVDVALRRYRNATGSDPWRAVDGAKLSQLETALTEGMSNDC